MVGTSVNSQHARFGSRSKASALSLESLESRVNLSTLSGLATPEVPSLAPTWRAALRLESTAKVTSLSSFADRSELAGPAGAKGGGHKSTTISPTPSPTPAPTPAPTSSGPVTVSVRNGSETVIQSGGGNTILVSQSGSTLTITANGQATTAAVTSGGLYIYGGPGGNTITVDASVNVRAWIATLNGTSDSVSNADPNASVWVDSADSVAGGGMVRRVSAFAGGVTFAAGDHLAEPTDAASPYVATTSMWGNGPVDTDATQGNLADCYFVASLGSMAQQRPGQLQTMAVDLGDGTYAVRFTRGGVDSFVRVSNTLSNGYLHPRDTSNVWGQVFEKAYAYYRNGANTYASLAWGYSSAVLNDLGVSNASLLGTSTSSTTLYNTLSAALAGGKPVTVQTNSSIAGGVGLVGSHVYSVVSVSNTNGAVSLTLRNPWGYDGAGSDANPYDGLVTITAAQWSANCYNAVYAV